MSEPIDLEALRRVAGAAPRGKWSIWTSNSWRRVFSDQRGRHVRVIEPTRQPDGHADLLFGDGMAPYLEAFSADVVLELLSEAQLSRTGEVRPDYMPLLRKAHTAIDMLLAQLIMADPKFTVTKSPAWPVVAELEALTRKEAR